MTLEIAFANRPCRGETVSGDTVLVLERPPAATLVVADGLGHGEKAALASQTFCDFIGENHHMPLPALMKAASRHSSHTRGAAAAIVRIDEQEEKLWFCGVGNIELQAISVHSIRPVCSPGIVGRPIRKILQFDYPMASGDMVALYSDGISSRFELKEYRSLGARECADAILENHGKYHDDATVLVARYRR